MTEVYVGQIMMTGFAFAPRTFAQCNGQILAINQNQAVFALLGTTYGGNGVSNFALPDLRSRTPAGGLGNYPMGMPAGVENVTLLMANLPTHTHLVDASTTAGNVSSGTGALYAKANNGKGDLPIYTEAANGGLIPLASGEVGMTGGSLPHPNIQPFAVINFNIALSGIYPSRN